MAKLKEKHDDPYLQLRQAPKDHELRLYLLEVNNTCPLCGKQLQSQKQKKTSQKFFEIAHIYPNSPTTEQEKTLTGLERLGTNSEAFENKIALCKDCHSTQDFRTTKEEYLKLLGIKKRLLREISYMEAANTLSLEIEIAEVVENLVNISENELASLNYTALKIVNKISSQEMLLKRKIRGYVMDYYFYIQNLFQDLLLNGSFNFKVLCMQIRACFEKLNNGYGNQVEIFDAIVSWIGRKTGNQSTIACEAVVAFFVQNCEVFDEITE